jgi:histidinol-phosphate aminotransferase
MMSDQQSSQKWPNWLPLRPALKSSAPYGAPQIRDVISLNTNENPNSLPDEVRDRMMDRIADIATTLNRYPDRDAIALRIKLAGYINNLSRLRVNERNIWAANGSNEILQTLFLAFGGSGRTAIGFTPSYSVHPMIANITGTSWIAGSRDGEFRIHAQGAASGIREVKPTLVFITTPNNPSGTSTPIADLELLAKAASDVGALLVVDEAYAEFSPETSAVALIQSNPNVVVTRTMSKAFAFAGVRVGYLVAHPQVVDAMLVTRLPYHLSALTQAAAEVALENSELLQAGIDEIRGERDRVQAAITLAGWKALPSSANFILFSGFSGSSASIWQRFLDQGVLIRDVSLEGYLRVTIGTPVENDAFIAAMHEIVQSKDKDESDPSRASDSDEREESR